MEKTETTIFVDWQNLLTDLIAIQEMDERFKESNFNFNNPEQILVLIYSFLESEEKLRRIYFYVSEPFTEVEPRIKGKKNEEFEEYKKKNPKEHEEKVNKLEIIQTFNHEIAQQNQVELRVGRVKYKFENISEEERHFGMEIRTNQKCLDLRQKGIDTLLVHDIAKICYTATSRRVLLFSKDTDFVPVLEAAWEKGFEVFIANIKENPNSVPQT
ncbi:NYN domain-containing protein [Helicobacter pylori]|uniref:NYN domain-containing protein n=1 Tax=Helicobacter pylori TaxID=210 RepID=UPI003C75A4F3